MRVCVCESKMLAYFLGQQVQHLIVRVCVCKKHNNTRSHFVAENKANIIADVAVSRALPAATSLRRRQAAAAAAHVRVGVCVR